MRRIAPESSVRPDREYAVVNLARHRHHAAAFLAVLVVAAACAVEDASGSGGITGASLAPTVREYDLGVRQFPQPLGGRFTQMPIRLWGAIGVPAGRGPFPVVIVGHGAAWTGCPQNENPMADVGTWPCWDVAQRNDLGMRYLVRALAARGFVAIAPDFNAAFTDAWGEPQEILRYEQVLNATTSALANANRGTTSFGVPLRGRLDLSRLGAAGHSRGGWHVLRWAERRMSRTGSADVAAGRGHVSALLLVQPSYNQVEPVTASNVPMTVVLGQCDGDVGFQGAQNYRRAERDPRRSAPIFKVLLHRANHTFFNTTWTARGRDDGPMVKTRACQQRRLTASEQRPWLGPVAVDVFRQGFGISTAPWMRRGAPFPNRLAGLSVATNRLYPPVRR